MARTVTATPWGIEAHPVHVEVDCRPGLPQIQIVGLPDTAVRESRDRVRTAIVNCGFPLPGRKVVISLAPADLRKEGNHLDLAIAIAILVAYEHLPADAVADRLFSGELGLDGSLRPIRGALALAELTERLDLAELVLPLANAPEAAALGTRRVRGAASLAETVHHLLGRSPLAPSTPPSFTTDRDDGGVDLAEVRGQQAAKRALEIAAAGGHNILFIGPPGSGKTMLARRLPGLLPPLLQSEAIAVTKIVSLAGRRTQGLVTTRPFRSPHTHSSTAALVGGGQVPRPGEVSLAHAGVLFLDELPQFKRDALEALRQPLEDGEVTIARVRARFTFPARFQLAAAMNPCPCGHLGDPRHDCRCTPSVVDRYRARISGPLLDRIDLHIEVPVPSLTDLRGPVGETTKVVAARVGWARTRQASRLGLELEQPINAAMGPDATREHCTLDGPGQRLLDAAYDRLGLSARALHRILKVARTIADLSGEDCIRSPHVAEAIQCRLLDRRVDHP